jgi:hypothetical protein
MGMAEANLGWLMGWFGHSMANKIKIKMMGFSRGWFGHPLGPRGWFGHSQGLKLIILIIYLFFFVMG